MIDDTPWAPHEPAVRLRGMAVDDAMQRRGLGRRVLEFAMGRAAMTYAPLTTLWCNARLIAVPFYESMGFEIHGERFEIEGIGPHYVMHRALPQAFA